MHLLKEEKTARDSSYHQALAVHYTTQLPTAVHCSTVACHYYYLPSTLGADPASGSRPHCDSAGPVPFGGRLSGAPTSLRRPGASSNEFVSADSKRTAHD